MRECKQQEGKPSDVFLKRIRTILAECKYPPQEQTTRLIDALIFSLKLENIQRTLLQKDENLTIDDALSIARTEEATRQQVEELRGKKIDVIQRKPKFQNRKNPRAETAVRKA